MRVALVSREVYPLGGGGVGQFVTAAARLLSRIAEVTIFTTSVFEDAHRRMRAAGDPRLPGEEVRIVFVAEPTVEEAGSWYHIMQCYGARVYAQIKEVYSDGAPDLIEFPDFLGEAFVTLQAAQTLDPFLTGVRVCVRLHTSAEMCEVLDGYLKPDLGSQALREMERFCLAHADRLIWQGGDILGSYQRFYGAVNLAPGTRIRYPYHGAIATRPAEVDDARQATQQRPLQMLYAGRLERRKGVYNLVRAVTGLPRDDFRLTLIGADTLTAPLGVSMREQLELAIADDPRIELRDPLARDALARAIPTYDVVVVPSLWECWPYAALEPLHLGRPILGTPVGGLVELVQPGRSGWLTRATDAEAIADAVEKLLDAPEEVQELADSQAPIAVARELSDEQEILDGYQALLTTGRPAPIAAAQRPGARLPLVSAIVPYYRAARYVRGAIDSLLAQTYPRLEIVLVNDGSFEDADWLLAELSATLPVVVVSQMNAGLGAARNLGVAEARGSYVFPLDCDNAAEPEFVARCVEVLERRPEVAYVTAWSRYIEDSGAPLPGPNLGYEPLGNQAALVARENVAGDAAALIRRRIFDAGFHYSEELTSFEDWHLYRELAARGHLGAVIPERLLRYRVRADSMQAQVAQPQRARLEAEIEALIRENAVRWTSSSA